MEGLETGKSGQRIRPSGVSLAVLAGLLVAGALAASPASSLRVKVMSASGTAVSGARVLASSESASESRTAVTNREGVCVLGDLEPGTYQVTVEVGSVPQVSRSNIRLEPGKQFNLQIRLNADPESGLGPVGFYDQPKFKPGQVNQSTESGGYSAAAYTDGYDLILSYLASAPATGKSDDDGARVAISLSPLPPDATESQFLARARDLLLARRFADAANVLSQGIERFPDSAELETGLGVAEYARGRYDEAVRALTRATDLAPSDPRPYLLLGKAYNVSKSQSAEVSRRLERWVQLEPKNALAYYYDALSLWKGRQAGNADLNRIESLLQRAAELDPHLADAPLELGSLYASEGRYSDAIREYRQAIKLKPDFAAAHYRLSQALLRSGDQAAAKSEAAVYESLRAKHPENR